MTPFQRLHHRPEPLLLPNAWDVASGLLLEAAGFEAVGTTSLGVTAAAGLPDGSGAASEDTLRLGAALAGRLRVPVTVDLEGGYSDEPGEVAALARRLASAGVAGINLEDGRDDGTIRRIDEHTAVIAAVVAAAPDLFVNARTDVFWLEIGERDGREEAATARLAAYERAGAHGVFLPGVADLAAITRVAAATTAPLNALWAPMLPLSTLAAAGVARVSTGSALYRRALAAALELAAAIRSSDGPGEEGVSYRDLQALLHR